MKKFLCRLLILTSLILIIIAALNIVYIYKYNKNAEETSFTNVPDRIQICNFGSSHGRRAFNYEDVEKNYVCFNFSLSAQSLLYDYRVLTHYKDKIQNGAVIFLVASYFSFFGKPEAEWLDFASRNRRYYKILPAYLIEQYDMKTDFYVNYFPALIADNLINFLETILITKKSSGNKVMQSDNEILKNSYSAYVRHFEGQKDKNGKRVYNHRNIESLYRIINICREAGAVPILTTPPFFHTYNETIRKYDPEFFDEFYGVIRKIVGNTGIKYYDYSSDSRYVYDKNLFDNADHLNVKGARLFTDNLLREASGIIIP